MVSAVYHLDHNKYYPLELRYDPETGKVDVCLPINPLYSGRFERNVTRSILSIATDDQEFFLERDGDTYIGTTTIQKGKLTNLSIRMRNQEFVQFRLNGTIEPVHETHQLIGPETAEIGRWPSAHLPYDRSSIASTHLYKPKIDIHTHSSGVFSAESMIEEALKLEPPFAYPTRLLKQENIAYPNTEESLTQVKRVFFPPLAHMDPPDLPEMEEAVFLRDLSDEAIAQLKAKMVFPPDQPETFGHMESPVYQLRYPFTKEDRLFAPLMWRGAREMASKGIVYTEMSMVSEVYNPNKLRELHKILPEIEDELGIKIRIRTALPRNLHPEQLQDMVNVIKVIGHSPYIVASDVIGYETNKTGELANFIGQIAKWAKASDSLFVIGAHAGENAKNPDNVLELVEIGLSHDIRVRVGHGINGLNDPTISAVVQHRRENRKIVFEKQPCSSIVLDNINRLVDLDNMLILDNNGVPVTLNSDGQGQYNTTPLQLALAAHFAGADDSFFENLERTERRHLRLQERAFRRKMDALPADFLETLEERIPPKTYTKEVQARYKTAEEEALEQLRLELKRQGIVHAPDIIEEDLKGKKPIFIGGAAGSNWEKLPDEQRLEVEIAMEMLPKIINTSTHYVSSGRTKEIGVARLASAAIKGFNEEAERVEIPMVGKLVEATHLDTDNMVDFTHIDLMPGTFVTLNKDIIDFVRANDGFVLACGGGAFTANQITIADNTNTPIGLMADVDGASKQKSKCMNPDYAFTGAKGMVHWIHQHDPSALRENFDIDRDLHSLYRATKEGILRDRETPGLPRLH